MAGREWRSTRSSMAVALLLFLAAGHAGCEDSPTAPSARALVTLQVGGEQFRIQLNSKDQVDAARRAQQGGTARIPSGRIILGTSENSGWSWHLEDAGVRGGRDRAVRWPTVRRGACRCSVRWRSLLPLECEHCLDRRELSACAPTWNDERSCGRCAVEDSDR